MLHKLFSYVLLDSFARTGAPGKARGTAKLVFLGVGVSVHNTVWGKGNISIVLCLHKSGRQPSHVLHLVVVTVVRSDREVAWRLALCVPLIKSGKS
jgi:hypothetical protein